MFGHSEIKKELETLVAETDRLHKQVLAAGTHTDPVVTILMRLTHVVKKMHDAQRIGF